MHIQEAESLRLRKSDCMKDSSGLKAGVLAEFDHHLHTEGPFSLLVAARQAKVLVDLSSNGTHRPVRHNGERRAHIDTGHETVSGRAIKTDTLIGQANPADCAFFDERFAHRHCRPYLNKSGCGDLLGYPLIELSERENHAVVLLHEFRNERKFHSVIAQAEERAECTNQLILNAKDERPPACTNGIQ